MKIHKNIIYVYKLHNIKIITAKSSHYNIISLSQKFNEIRNTTLGKSF